MNKTKLKSLELKKRIIFISMIIIVNLTLFLLILMSPYKRHAGYDHKLIKKDILIEASVGEVYKYLGNSDNASNWSVYVDHISPLNADKVADGRPGSKRRCFVNQNEKGKKWDEEVLYIQENKKRHLSCYNYKGFLVTAGTLHTEQVYKSLNDNQCMVSLTLFFPEGKTSKINHIKMALFSYRVAKVFKRNLENIKKFNEIT